MTENCVGCEIADTSLSLWIGSILSIAGFFSTFFYLLSENKTFIYASIMLWIFGILIYRLGCDSWF